MITDCPTAAQLRRYEGRARAGVFYVTHLLHMLCTGTPTCRCRQPHHLRVVQQLPHAIAGHHQDGRRAVAGQQHLGTGKFT